MNSYKKLIHNSLIFAAGNFGSKLITIILVPFYTYHLTTSQYGTVDLLITTILLLLPIVFSSVFDAILRFLLDKEENSRSIVTNSFIIGIIGYSVTLLFYPLIDSINLFGNNLIFLYSILLLKFFESFLAQYSRAKGMLKKFAFNGILLSIVMGISGYILLAFFNLGINGYLFSHVISNAVSVLYLFFSTKIYNEFSIDIINWGEMKKIFKYSVPLIPNAVMWWLVSASSRYIILLFVGVAANGLYGVASKIPSIISLLNQIFTQAWQISAIEENDSKNKSQFHANVFKYMSSFLFLGTAILTLMNKVLFITIFSSEYFEAWKAVPFLALSAVFSSFSGFFGTNYIVAKETKGIFKTSIYGGMISILLNFLLIPIIGIQGASISSVLSFFCIFLIRYSDTKKFINISINWDLLSLNILVILGQILVQHLMIPLKMELIVNSLLFLFMMILNRSIIISLVNSIKKPMKKTEEGNKWKK